MVSEGVLFNNIDALYRIAGAEEAEVMALWLSVRERFISYLQVDINTLINNRDWQALDRAIENAYREIERDLSSALRRASAASGSSSAALLGAPLAMDVFNPRASLWASTRAAERVIQVTNDQKIALREIISRGLRTGESIDKIAASIRQVVGLHSRYARAVDNYRLGMQEAGLKQELIDKRVNAYSNKLLRLRAKTIARHETMLAADKGQEFAWKALVEQGLLTAEETYKVWIASIDERTDPECADLDGTEIPFNSSFPGGDPPRHTKCRCVLALRRKDTPRSDYELNILSSRKG